METLPIKQEKDVLHYTEIGNTLYISYRGKDYIYTLENTPQKVNEQQFNLPEGFYIKYSDGSIFHHRGEYALIRNWRMKDGSMRDRVAIPWSNLYM